MIFIKLICDLIYWNLFFREEKNTTIKINIEKASAFNILIKLNSLFPSNIANTRKLITKLINRTIKKAMVFFEFIIHYFISKLHQGQILAQQKLPLQLKEQLR